MSGAPSRPRSAIGAVLPQRPQVRSARPQWRRHSSQIGPPAASRAATGLSRPQLLQAPARCQARQRWQTPAPSPRVEGLPVRPQRPQRGTVRTAEPQAISSIVSLPAIGGAPSCSASGPPASARSRCPSACPPAATESTASATLLRGMVGSAAAAKSTTRSRRQPAQLPRRCAGNSCPAGQRGLAVLALYAGIRCHPGAARSGQRHRLWCGRAFRGADDRFDKITGLAIEDVAQHGQGLQR